MHTLKAIPLTALILRDYRASSFSGRLQDSDQLLNHLSSDHDQLLNRPPLGLSLNHQFLCYHLRKIGLKTVKEVIKIQYGHHSRSIRAEIATINVIRALQLSAGKYLNLGMVGKFIHTAGNGIKTLKLANVFRKERHILGR